MMKFAGATFAFAAALVLAACGGDTTTSRSDAAAQGASDAPSAPPDTVPTNPDAAVGSALTLVVPATYAGTPRQLAVVGANSVPIAGPPAAVFLIDDAPAPVAGQAMHLELDTSGASGDLYVVAVLYQEGGGQFQPEPGVDYVAQSAASFHFTGAPMELGSLDLALAP
jgi:hypothetical protein